MRLLALLLFLFSAFYAFSQVSSSDCVGATVLCGDLYTEENAPPGTGDFYEYTGPCNQNLETMSLWYTFTVHESGDLSFILTPNDLQDDYDWGLFEITSGGCEGISDGGSSPTVSCNSWGSLIAQNGATGISTANGGISNTGGPGDAFGPPFNANLPVTVGETYALVVMNWSNSTNGYTIDFGESSASLYEQEPPTPIALTKDCNNNQLVVTFSELVVSNTAENLDFEISGPQGVFQISNVLPLNPFNSLEDQFVLSPTVNITQAGTYTLSITNSSNSISDPCGNLAIGSIILEIPLPITYEVNTTTACNSQGGSIAVTDISGGSGYLDFYLNNVLQTEYSIADLNPGNYVVSLRDESNCFVNTQVNVPNQNISVAIAAQDTLSCALPSFALDGVNISPNQDVSFAWDFWTGSSFIPLAVQDSNPVINAAGLYQLTILNVENGCSAQTSIDIYASEENNMEFSALVSDACNGEGGSILLQNISGGNGDYDIFLDDTQLQGPEINNLLPGQYSVLVQDGNDCSVTHMYEVINNTLSVSIPAQDSFTCTTNSITIEDVDVSPSQAVSYAWFQILENGSIATGDSIVDPTFFVAGDYELVVVNLQTGCSSSALVTLTSNVPENFSFDYLITTACNGMYGSIEITTISGGTEPYSLIADNTIQDDFLVDELEDGFYSLQLIDQNDCIAEVEVEVPNHILNIAIPSQDSLACNTPNITMQDVEIAPIQNATFEWFYYDPMQGYVSINQPVLDPQVVMPGIYRLIATSIETGCSNSLAVEIYYSEENTLDLEVNAHTACNGLNGSIEILEITGGTEPYSITLNGNQPNGLEFSPLENGNYELLIIDAHNCIQHTVVTVPNHLMILQVPDQDKLTCSHPTTEIVGTSIQPEQEVSYDWYFLQGDEFEHFLSGDDSPIVSTIGTYNLTITNPLNGCFVSDVFELEAGDLTTIDLSKIQFPNVFTPNGDSKNEDWAPFLSYDSSINLLNLLDTYELKVFNRWGNVVFDSTESNSKRWTITDEEEGTYFYVVKYSASCGGNQSGEHQGTVQILR